jgi:uncharacterized protein (TIGR00255 family)
MKSMTGFGRAELDAPFGRIIVEIQSVNRKFLEVNVSLPKDFHRFENGIRKVISDEVHRGSVSARIQILPNSAGVDHLLPDVTMLQSLKDGWEKIATGLGYDRSAVSFQFLLSHSSEKISLQKVVNEEDFILLSQCAQKAVADLQDMKLKEGKALAVDISSRLNDIGTKVAEIEKGAPDVVQKLRQKLKDRMEELFTPGVELDDRLLREVALHAERLDISEEIIRFRSHIVQYTDLLKSKEASGRKMDFLVQEMGREINTMGSKSMDAKIAHLVVEVKSELEKIREQIQNIE